MLQFYDLSSCNWTQNVWAENIWEYLMFIFNHLADQMTTKGFINSNVNQYSPRDVHSICSLLVLQWLIWFGMCKNFVTINKFQKSSNLFSPVTLDRWISLMQSANYEKIKSHSSVGGVGVKYILGCCLINIYSLKASEC